MARIAVVRGGRSLEREMSLRSGHHVCTALRHLDHEVHEVDVDERLAHALEESDAVFIALHGRDGEDGTIQAILEALGVPYTGSSPLTCRLCFDKGLAGGLLRRAGLTTPEAYVVSAEAVRRMGAGVAVRAAAERLGYPVVVKPATQGSALGLSIARSAEELSAAVMAAFDYGERILLERFVDGPELAVGVFGDPLEALPPVEIRTTEGVFDFHARVSPGGADFACPPALPAEVLETAKRTAVDACAPFEVRDFARVDLRLAGEEPVVLDVKPCPGLTESSLVPLAVAEAGLPFERFLEGIVSTALTRGSSARA